MAKFNFVTLLLAGLLGSAAAGPSFYLRAQPYGLPDEIQHTDPLFLTRHGFLTSEKNDADAYTITEKGELVTFSGKARSQKMGIIPNNTEPTPLTSITPRLPTSKKITTNFTLSSRFDDNDIETKILSFENESFQNSQKEAVFVVSKSKQEGLDGEKVLVVTVYKEFDWSKFVLLDLGVEVEQSGGDDDGPHEEM